MENPNRAAQIQARIESIEQQLGGFSSKSRALPSGVVALFREIYDEEGLSITIGGEQRAIHFETIPGGPSVTIAGLGTYVLKEGTTTTPESGPPEVEDSSDELARLRKENARISQLEAEVARLKEKLALVHKMTAPKEEA